MGMGYLIEGQNKKWARHLAQEYQYALGYGLCDWCGKPIEKGDGYLINQAVQFVFSSDTPDLICQVCFDKENPKAWDGGGRYQTTALVKTYLVILISRIKQQRSLTIELKTK